MDGPVAHDPAIDRSAIEAAARDMGIVPGDPAYSFVQFMLRSVDAHAAEHRSHEARLARLLDRAEMQAGGQIAAAAAGDLPTAIKQLTVRMFWRTSLIAAAAGLGLLLIGVGGGYWFGSHSAAERYASLPVEYNVAMKNHNAARWLDLMRKNAHDTALDGCTEVKQPAGGKACSFVLWTELPPAQR